MIRRLATLPLCLLTLTAVMGIAPSGMSTPPGGLRPSEPAEYLRTGEDLIVDDQTLRLGRETLALAVLLNAGTDPSTAASAAIALAGVARSSDEHAGLWALAVQIDPSRREDWRWLGTAASPDAQLDRAAAAALGALRRNESGSGELITAPLRERIVATAAQLGHDPSRVSSILIRWASDARSDPCKGRLFVRERAGDGIRSAPCPDPSFHHGMRADEEWSVMIGIELSLLHAGPTAWPAQTALGLDTPVPVWDLARVAREYGVSADRAVYRSGGWVAR